jgi:hypothetical protein
MWRPDVGTGAEMRFSGNAEEVVRVRDLAVLDEQRVATKPRPVGEDDPLASGLELELGEHLVRHAVHVGR